MLTTGLMVLGVGPVQATPAVKLLAQAGICFDPAHTPLAEALNPYSLTAQLQQGISQHLHRPLQDVRCWPEDWARQAVLAPQRNALRRLAELELLSVPLWGVQAQGLGRFLPLWREALTDLPLNWGCLWLLPDPQAYLGEVMQRWRLTPNQAALFWLAEMLETERHSRVWPRILLPLDAFCADPARYLPMLASRLGWPPGLWQPVTAGLEAVLPADLPLVLPAWLTALYDHLASIAQDGGDLDPASWESLTAPLVQAQALYDRYVGDYYVLTSAQAQQMEQAQLQQTLATLQETHTQTLVSLQHQRQQTDVAQHHWLHALRLALNTSLHTVQGAEQQIERLHAALVAQQHTQTALQQELTRINGHWSRQFGDVAATLTWHQQEHTRLRLEARQNQAQAEHYRQELQCLQGSKAWRLITWYRQVLGNRLRRWLTPARLRMPEAGNRSGAEAAPVDVRPTPAAGLPVAPSPPMVEQAPVAGPPPVPRTALRVLVIDEYIPMPDRDSGSLRAWEILKILRALDCQVTWAAHKPVLPGPYTERLEQLGIQCLHQQNAPDLSAWLHQSAVQFDVAILSRAPVAELYLGLIRRRFPQALLIFDTVDLYFVREARAAHLRGQAPGFEEHRRRLVEVATARFADVTWVVSEADRAQLLAQDTTIQTEVVSNIVLPALTPLPFAARSGIAFLGGYWHQPNVDAVLYYLQEIHPLVREQLPGVVCYILGSHPTAAILAQAREDVIVTGYLPDLEPCFAALRVFVAPLRYGSGVKGKINTSLSFGVPVVTTAVGAEGMTLRDGVEALLADGPADFARAVVRLYQDEGLWQQLRQAGAALLNQRFSPAQAQRAIAATLERVPYFQQH